jgi:hypothetical protein
MVETCVPIYYETEWPEDTLPRLHAELMREPDTAWMWGLAQPLSLTKFIQYFSLGQCVLLLPCFRTATAPTAADVLGLIWLTQVIVGHRAIVHFYVFSRFRRHRVVSSRYVGQLAIETMRNPPLSLRSLYFFTPLRHRPVLNYSVKMGVQYTGVLPHYHRIGERFEDVAVGYFDLTE